MINENLKIKCSAGAKSTREIQNLKGPKRERKSGREMLSKESVWIMSNAVEKSKFLFYLRTRKPSMV